MVDQRHAVQRNNFEFSTIELEIDIAVSGGIDDAPELPLAWVNADRRTNLTVHSENSPYFIRLASARRSLRLHATQESGGIRGIFDGLATYDKHLLAQVTNFRGIAVHSFNHNRPGHAVERLSVTLTMRMRVIPEESRRVICGNFHHIVERFARHGHHVDHIVLRGLWRNLQAVKMQICHIGARGDGTTFLGVNRQVIYIVDLK